MSKTTVLDNASQDCAGGSGVQSKHILGPRQQARKRRGAAAALHYSKHAYHLLQAWHSVSWNFPQLVSDY